MSPDGCSASTRSPRPWCPGCSGATSGCSVCSKPHPAPWPSSWWGPSSSAVWRPYGRARSLPPASANLPQRRPSVWTRGRRWDASTWAPRSFCCSGREGSRGSRDLNPALPCTWVNKSDDSASTSFQNTLHARIATSYQLSAE